MRILYNFWGFLSNRYGISAPDGNASYSPWIVNELTRRGHEVYGGPIDRDLPVIKDHGLGKSFSGFMTRERIKAYKSIRRDEVCRLPEMDVVLLEWRFPTSVNTLSKDSPEYNPDLEIQNLLLARYNDRSRIVIMDLDKQLTLEDTKHLRNVKILSQDEVGLGAPREALRPSLDTLMSKKMSYVGNDYRRRDDIDKKIVPLSDMFPNEIYFYGNWLREDKDEFRKERPNINYQGRIGLGEFGEAMTDSLCVPLLAPEDYREQGFMTFRIVETLMFGSVPLGYSDFKGIDKFLPKELIVDSTNEETIVSDSIKIFNKLQIPSERERLRNEVADRVSQTNSIETFVNEVLQ